jgi:molybdopterin-guanine dinucleotide biosynthesis protein B
VLSSWRRWSVASSVPVLSVVGRSNSGKTTLIVKLLQWLTARGWRVGTIKHDVHGFTMDYEGKDTYRHFNAGADRVLIAGAGEIAFRQRAQDPPEREALVGRFFDGVDMVITEGYKTGDWPKIEVVRKARSTEPLCLGDSTLRAVVSDMEGPFPVPAFGLDEVDRLGLWIENSFLGGRR